MRKLLNNKKLLIIIGGGLLLILSLFILEINVNKNNDGNNKNTEKKILIDYRYHNFLQKYKISLNEKFPEYLDSMEDLPFVKRLFKYFYSEKKEMEVLKKKIVENNICYIDNLNNKSVKKFLKFFDTDTYIYEKGFNYLTNEPIKLNDLPYTGLIFLNLGDNLSYTFIKEGYPNFLTVLCDNTGYPLKITNYIFYKNKQYFYSITGIFNNINFKLNKLYKQYKRKDKIFDIDYNEKVEFFYDNGKVKKGDIILKNKNRNEIEIHFYDETGEFLYFYYKYKDVIIKYENSFNNNSYTIFLYKVKNKKILKGIKYVYVMKDGILHLEAKIKLGGGFIVN